MAGLGRQGAEKVERFYLSSCASQVTATSSKHQTFPAASDSNNEPKDKDDSNNRCYHRSRSPAHLSKSQSPPPRDLSSDACTPQNQRAKLAFERVANSFMSLGGQTNTHTSEIHVPQTSTVISNVESKRLPIDPSLSKEEFLERLQCMVEDMRHPTESRGETRQSPYSKTSVKQLSKASPHSQSKSPTPKKSTTTTSTVVQSDKSRNNYSQQDSRHPNSRPSPPGSSTPANLAVIGFFLIILFGIIKSAKVI